MGHGEVERGRDLKRRRAVALANDARGFERAARGVVYLEPIDELGDHVGALSIRDGQRRGLRREDRADGRGGGDGSARLERLCTCRGRWQERQREDGQETATAS